jgi:hypothetical protein
MATRSIISVTVIVAVPITLPSSEDLAVMVTLPEETPVTMPVALTVAIVWLLLLHTTLLINTCAGNTVAVSCRRSLTRIVAAAGVTVTLVGLMIPTFLRIGYWYLLGWVELELNAIHMELLATLSISIFHPAARYSARLHCSDVLFTVRPSLPVKVAAVGAYAAPLLVIAKWLDALLLVPVMVLGEPITRPGCTVAALLPLLVTALPKAKELLITPWLPEIPPTWLVPETLPELYVLMIVARLVDELPALPAMPPVWVEPWMVPVV